MAGPRMRKTPKPKKPTYERIDRKADKLNVYEVLDEMIVKYKRDLEAEKCQIALAWRYGLKRNKDGQLVLGKCKKVSDLDKQFQGFDFIIILNYEAWSALDDAQRRALVHHELCHCAISTDPNGNTKKDSRNRTMFRIKKHDIEEFGEVVEYHGCYKEDLSNFVLTAVNSKRPPQPTIPGLAEPAKSESESEPVADTLPMASAARHRKRVAK
jgi:hypothetical protein